MLRSSWAATPRLEQADLVVVSRVSPTDRQYSSCAAARTQIIGELELASRWVKGPIVAITGTKRRRRRCWDGCSRAGRDVLVGGNIGVPLSAQVDASTSEAVHRRGEQLQLETTVTFRPWIALWLNFADHLDRHPTVGAYAAAKARIFANQRPGDFAVVNADDPAVMAPRHRRRARHVLAVRKSLGRLSRGRDWIVKRTPTAVEDSFRCRRSN